MQLGSSVAVACSPAQHAGWKKERKEASLRLPRRRKQDSEDPNTHVDMTQISLNEHLSNSLGADIQTTEILLPSATVPSLKLYVRKYDLKF